jgi:hypothetical protein
MAFHTESRTLDKFPAQRLSHARYYHCGLLSSGSNQRAERLSHQMIVPAGNLSRWHGNNDELDVNWLDEIYVGTRGR